MHIGLNEGANRITDQAAHCARDGRSRGAKATGLIRLLGLLALTVTAGCGSEEKGCIYGCGGGEAESDDSGIDTAPPEETGDPVDTSDSGDDPEQSRFEEAGDVVEFEDEDGEVFLDLSDESGDESNQDQEFLYVIVNAGESDLGYQLSYVRSEADDEDAEGPPPAKSRVELRSQ